MKFTQAWASTASQNIALKLAVAALSLCVVVLAFSAARLSMKDPLIIERSCYSRTVSKASTQHDAQEIETFVREAIAERFNSEFQTKSTFLSVEEDQVRSNEQKELVTKGMSQRVVVSAVKINGSIVTVDADRIISAGQIRSAFIFPLTVTVATEARSESNPYGLVLTKVEVRREQTNSASVGG